jgi:hypothetical protein
VVVANLSGVQKSHVDNFDVVFVVICSPQKSVPLLLLFYHNFPV